MFFLWYGNCKNIVGFLGRGGQGLLLHIFWKRTKIQSWNVENSTQTMHFNLNDPPYNKTQCYLWPNSVHSKYANK